MMRSLLDLERYTVGAVDGSVGKVVNFLIDDQRWAVRYLTIDTRNWWFGKQVLIAPAWSKRVSWGERKVYVDLSRQAIKDSPAWNGSLDLNRDYETRLHEHYAQTMYWRDEPSPGDLPVAHRPENSVR